MGWRPRVLGLVGWLVNSCDSGAAGTLATATATDTADDDADNDRGNDTDRDNTDSGKALATLQDVGGAAGARNEDPLGVTLAGTSRFATHVIDDILPVAHIDGGKHHQGEAEEQ